MNYIEKDDFYSEVLKRAIELRDDLDFTLQEVVKNNDCTLTALVIRKQDEEMGAMVYLNPLYDDFTHGISIDSILNTIFDSYADMPAFKRKLVLETYDFNSVKDKLCLKLINFDRNQEYLKDKVFKRFLGNLAVTCYYKPFSDCSITITEGLLHTWKITEDELFDIARANTQKQLCFQFDTIGTAINKAFEESVGESDLPINLEEDDIEMYVVSNDTYEYGATALLYEEVLEQAGDFLKSDFYVLPSSIHELLVLPAKDNMDIIGLKEIVSYINQTEVPECDYLSDTVYLYSRADKTLTAV